MAPHVIIDETTLPTSPPTPAAAGPVPGDPSAASVPAPMAGASTGTAPTGSASTGSVSTSVAPTSAAIAPALPAGMGPGEVAAWLAMSAAWADEVPWIADRDDLLVTVAPGAGKGSPACFLPAHAMIEVDGVHLGVDPATVSAHDLADRARYTTAWGLLTHECAHARHSVWTAPEGAPPGAVAAALLLEESRIEHAQIRRRPDDRHWLRASATNLVLADTRTADPVAGPKMTRQDAATAAALVLARADAGILTVSEVARVTDTVKAILGPATHAELRAIWRQALRTADDDAEAMIELGRRWCAAIGTDPDSDPTPPPEGTPGATPAGGPAAGNPTPPTGAPAPGASKASSGASPDVDPAPDAASANPGAPSRPDSDSGTGSESGPDSGEGGSGEGDSGEGPEGERSELAQALEAVAAKVAAAVARTRAPGVPVRRAKPAADPAAERAARTAARVFAPSDNSALASGDTRISGTRTPTHGELQAARLLGRALTTAGIRDRVVTKTPSVLPPGRLRMRGAMAADAQRAAGAIPTATPFTRIHRAPVPTPPLRLGIACDVSGSMTEVTGAVASAAWILAAAVDHARIPASATATVIFGAHVRPITRPGVVPKQVTEFPAEDGIEEIADAVDALDGALDLSRTGAARLLVVISDGQYVGTRRRHGQARITRLRASGCGVLWLAPAGYRAPLEGATVHQLDDPATTATAIGRAATAALRAAR